MAGISGGPCRARSTASRLSCAAGDRRPESRRKTLHPDDLRRADRAFAPHHSSHPREYPVAGLKPVSGGLWSRTVIEERKTFVANSIEAIAEVFPDHELIRSLGCGSVVNLPVVFNGMVIGVANALDAFGHYTPERVERMERLAPFVTIALLAARVAAPKFEPSRDDRA